MVEGRAGIPTAEQSTCSVVGPVGMRALIEPDLVGVDRGDVTEADHVLYPAELRELTIAERGAVVGGRRHGGVEASQLARGFQSCEDVVDRVGEGDRFDLIGEALRERGEEPVAGLEVGPVQHP